MAGIPTLFADRVRDRIRSESNYLILCSDLTFGRLINYINNEGLALCRELKLKAKIKNEKFQHRKEVTKLEYIKTKVETSGKIYHIL